MQFPQEFLWGTATAAHQVEGNNVNSDFWVLEHLPHTMFTEPSGDAVDHYHRYRDDIALLAELGFNSYRFSIEWARVEPEDGFFSKAMLDHYRRMLETCLSHGMKPMVTLHHFTSPRWVVAQGGWTHAETAAKFARYAARVMHDLGDLVEYVCTINEMNIPTMAKLFWRPDTSEEVQIQQRAFEMRAAKAFAVSREQFAPFMFAVSEQGRDVILDAHQQAVAAVKAERGDIQVGMTLALADMQALEGGEIMRDYFRHELQDVFLEVARADDFIGVQTYTRDRFGPEGRLPPEEGVEQTQMGYEFWPEALEGAMRYAAEFTSLPVIVTENGIGTEDDARRIEYYRRALQGVVNCLNAGMDVRGYYAWSAFDNFEWMMGYRPTFGLIAVDRETQMRAVKPSARWLGEIAKANVFDEK